MGVLKTLMVISLFVSGSVFGMDRGLYELWSHYKETFINEKGFVVDPYNQFRVTSEAQGYTMVISALIDDKETFYNVWNWTKGNLLRKDNLFSWLWVNGNVVDKNNASDADLLIAYGLILGYKRWGDKSLFEQAKKIVSSLQRLIIPVCSEAKDYLLLPGAEGFVQGNSIIIKPAYYIPFVFRALYDEFGDDVWIHMYAYSYKIYSMSNLSTNLYYDLLEKQFIRDKYIDSDAYRVIIYSYIDNYSTFVNMKKNFEKIYSFYRMNGYIPEKYSYKNEGSSSSQGVPFCFYYFFGELYNDRSLFKKFEEGLRYDKKNYYCYALMLIAWLHK